MHGCLAHLPVVHSSGCTQRGSRDFFSSVQRGRRGHCRRAGNMSLATPPRRLRPARRTSPAERPARVFLLRPSPAADRASVLLCKRPALTGWSATDGGGISHSPLCRACRYPILHPLSSRWLATAASVAWAIDWRAHLPPAILPPSARGVAPPPPPPRMAAATPSAAVHPSSPPVRVTAASTTVSAATAAAAAVIVPSVVAVAAAAADAAGPAATAAFAPSTSRPLGTGGPTTAGSAPAGRRLPPPPAAAHAGAVCRSARRIRAASRAPLS